MDILFSVRIPLCRKGVLMTIYLEDDALLIRTLMPDGATPPKGSKYLFILYALLLRTKGESVTLSDVHDAWASWMLLAHPEHSALVPFEQLPEDVQQEDLPYLDAI